MKRYTKQLLVISLVTSATAAQGAVIGELGILDSSTGLAAGDEYRLIFITSGTTTATDTDIAFYNTFVQNAASAAGLGAATWSVVGSSETVDARDNTGTNPGVETGVPVYLTDGTTLVALDNSDLWDGVPSGLIRIDENGDERTNNRIFTGTDPGGVSHPSQFFGATNVQTGDNTSLTKTGISWHRDFNVPSSNTQPVYAISSVLTAVPEPSSLTLLGLGSLLVARRRGG